MFEAKINVRYVETDAMGFAHHASYYHWMEVARVEYMAKAGLKYSDFEKLGLALPVSESGCRYRKPVLFEDDLLIRTWISKLTDVSMRIEYDILRMPQEEMMAHGFTVHPVINKERKIVRMPSEIRAIFEPIIKREGAKNG